MSDVKRWKPIGVIPFGAAAGKRLMLVRPDGGWVRFTDYDALVRERDALAKDAARWAWFRAYWGSMVVETQWDESRKTRIATHIDLRAVRDADDGESIDATIDAAMAKQA